MSSGPGGPVGWVIFDYGNVISKPQPAEDIAALARAAGTGVAEFGAAYWPRRIDYDRADLDAAEFWGGVAERLGQRWDDRRIAELARLDAASWTHLRPGTASLIEELSASGQRLAMLSNAPVEVAEVVADLPLLRHFEHLVFSCYVKATKPDPDCYYAALELIGARPAETVFIDDRPENVAAASRLGIGALRFSTPEALRPQLLALLGR